MEKNIWGSNFSEIENTKINNSNKASSDMEQIFNFIKENDLKDVQFQYDQKKGIAFVRGTKDGYSYGVKLDFRGESHE